MQCTVLITSFIPTGHIRVFDSIHDDISTDTINQICCIVRSKRSKIKIDIIDVCKQKGTNDCGLYALANATLLCEGELPQSKDYIQEDMRSHLQECFKNVSRTVLHVLSLQLIGTGTMVILKRLN